MVINIKFYNQKFHLYFLNFFYFLRLSLIQNTNYAANNFLLTIKNFYKKFKNKLYFLNFLLNKLFTSKNTLFLQFKLFLKNILTVLLINKQFKILGFYKHIYFFFENFSLKNFIKFKSYNFKNLMQIKKKYIVEDIFKARFQRRLFYPYPSYQNIFYSYKESKFVLNKNLILLIFIFLNKLNFYLLKFSYIYNFYNLSTIYCFLSQ